MTSANPDEAATAPDDELKLLEEDELDELEEDEENEELLLEENEAEELLEELDAALALIYLNLFLSIYLALCSKFIFLLFSRPKTAVIANKTNK